MVVLRVGHPGQAKVTDLEVTGGVEQEVAGLQVPVEDIGRVNVLEAPHDLVDDKLHLVVCQLLDLDDVIQVQVHQRSHHIPFSKNMVKHITFKKKKLTLQKTGR